MVWNTLGLSTLTDIDPETNEQSWVLTYNTNLKRRIAELQGFDTLKLLYYYCNTIFIKLLLKNIKELINGNWYKKLYVYILLYLCDIF